MGICISANVSPLRAVDEIRYFTLFVRSTSVEPTTSRQTKMHVPKWVAMNEQNRLFAERRRWRRHLGVVSVVVYLQACLLTLDVYVWNDHIMFVLQVIGIYRSKWRIWKKWEEKSVEMRAMTEKKIVNFEIGWISFTFAHLIVSCMYAQVVLVFVVHAHFAIFIGELHTMEER